MTRKLCGIGEALIDFIPEVKGTEIKGCTVLYQSSRRGSCQCSRCGDETWDSVQVFDKTWRRSLR